ncbi:MAG: hypothetical protein COB84_07055 [Rhodobacteraceae bacterium]|nr:MAG: hypothetical protein COB84_07055 [Paracoccaceae bacterium]
MEKKLNPLGNIQDNTGIKDLIILLNAEITAIDNGDLDHVLDLYDQKTALLERLKSASPEIESQLTTKPDENKGLRDDLTELLALIQKDAQLLANMTKATREIITEIARIRGRHNLDGLYGSEGKKRVKVVSYEQQIDKSV